MLKCKLCINYPFRPNTVSELFLSLPLAVQFLENLDRLLMGGFEIVSFQHLAGLLEGVSIHRKGSAYTGQHNKERRGQTSML
jgi:hypothetical protein